MAMASVKVFEIVNVFTQAPMDLSIHEDCERTSISFGLQKDDTKLPDDAPIVLLSSRDGMTIRWRQMDFDDFDNTDYLSDNDNWNCFKEEYEAEPENSELSVEITIDKHQVNHCLSVYDIGNFTTTLLNKSTFAFLCSINSVFENFLYFEVFDATFQTWHTQSIAFKPNRGDFKLNEEDCIKVNRNQKFASRKDICYVEGLDEIKLLPEDFYLPKTTNDMQKTFLQISCMLSQSFLFDKSQIIENKYNYKLLGLIAYPHKEYNISHVSRLANATPAIFFNIYKWVYSDGGLFDKISIARNIISLNIDEADLSLNTDTFYSILSNYQIYEKENSLQYIELRNKISEILLGLQEKIDKISNDYVDGMMKSIFTVFSFIITTIVIRMIAKQDIIKGFSFPILVLMSALVVASFLHMLLYRNIVSKKIKLFIRHYEQISMRYNKLLCKNELEKVFEDSNPDMSDSHASILQSRMKWITCIWSLIVLAFGIAITILFITAE